MTTTAKNLLLGATSLAAVIGLVTLLLLFGELETLVKPRYELTILCRNAVGLRAGSSIELNGVPVGLVDRIENTTDPLAPVRITARLDRDARIPVDVIPYATSSLLGGSATLQFESRTDGSDQFLPADGTASIREPIRSRLMEEFTGEIDARFDPVVEAMEEFRGLARSLNDLLGQADREEREGNIRTAVELLNEVLIDVRETLQLAKSWLGDEQLQADTRAAIQNANTLMEQATDAMDRFGQLATRLETDAHGVTTELMVVMDEISITLEEVQALARVAREGEGTIAQLLNNADLYRSLDDAAIRLERTLREAELLIGKVKAEGIPVLWP